MWKNSKKHEDARKFYKTNLVDGTLKAQVEKMVTITCWRTRHGEEGGQKWRSADLRQRVRPQLVNWFQPVKRDTKEYGKMLRRTLILEEERVPAKDAVGWKIEGQRRRVIRKEYKRLRGNFEVGSFMAQKLLLNVAKKRSLED